MSSKRKTEALQKESLDARPCTHCDIKEVCMNDACFLYAAYVQGQNVPISLIMHMNRVRDND